MAILDYLNEQADPGIDCRLQREVSVRQDGQPRHRLIMSPPDADGCKLGWAAQPRSFAAAEEKPRLSLAERFAHVTQAAFYHNVIALLKIHRACVAFAPEPPYEVYAIGVDRNWLAVGGFELNVTVHDCPLP
ncbi:hypothetical protein [Novosphingobium sp. Rr 2-17]|uniref:hypothetical protein n=1 Tax=Novosphingobium sp. Rr 2-17 TaxID=555793 RepID=UPI00178C288A|nr:hypothetical protein [Novosphingobium sp. Rr 2-17]